MVAASICNTPTYWLISDIKEPNDFLNNLPLLLSDGDILYFFEGCSIRREVSEFYELHRAGNAMTVMRDTIYPVPETYHVAFSPEVILKLQEFAAACALPELFDHIKAYRGESMLFTFHDAFHGELLISEHIAELVVMEFCKKLGVSCHQEQNKWDAAKSEQELRRFAEILDHPEKAQLGKDPWWKRWFGR